MASSPAKVFSSYSHDSIEHKELVLRFARRLRDDDIDAQIDQFVGGRSTEDWPRWMLNKLDWAEFVLLICTETYYRRFRGYEVPIGVQSDGFELSDPKKKYRLDGSSIYLSVRKRPGLIAGRVQDGNGNPLSDAKIFVAGLSATSDSAGHFEIVIPDERLQAELEFEAFAAGYKPKHLNVVPDSNEVVVNLTPTP